MATAKELIDAVEAFLTARKSISGAYEPCIWGPGYSQYERKTTFPIEVNGELPEAARLEIIGFPQAAKLTFRLSLCFNCAICRLDYTDETHANTMRIASDGIPHSVTGPHFHSWRVNRRFFKGTSTAPKLHNAERFVMNASFDSILRWFCQETKIDQLGPGHMIELPPRDRLL
jgi:hypothetical protein